MFRNTNASPFVEVTRPQKNLEVPLLFTLQLKKVHVTTSRAKVVDILTGNGGNLEVFLPLR